MLLALALLTAAPAAPPVDVATTFAQFLPQVNARTRLTVLLPDTMPSDGTRLFPSAVGSRRSYSFGLDAAPDCGGANACFVADFSARRRGRPFGKRTVHLARGRTGRFQPLSCGGSCAPPSISWRERGATYTFQARVGTKKTEKRILVRMANQAIRFGPR
jgi:hypothetical protein